MQLPSTVNFSTFLQLIALNLGKNIAKGPRVATIVKKKKLSLKEPASSWNQKNASRYIHLEDI